MQNTSRRTPTKPIGQQASAPVTLPVEPGFIHKSVAAVSAQGLWLWATIIGLLAVTWLVTTDYLPRLFGTM